MKSTTPGICGALAIFMIQAMPSESLARLPDQLVIDPTSILIEPDFIPLQPPRPSVESACARSYGVTYQAYVQKNGW